MIKKFHIRKIILRFKKNGIEKFCINEMGLRYSY